jgi:Short C-terminal domain
MGFRRRRRRRAVIAGAAIASSRNSANQQQDYEQAPADEQADSAPPAGPAEEIEHLAELHDSGALTDEEFADAKANVLAG